MRGQRTNVESPRARVQLNAFTEPHSHPPYPLPSSPRRPPSFQVVCSRRPDSPYLLSALLPVLESIKRLEGAARVGSSSGGEASALGMRLQVNKTRASPPAD